MAPITLVLYAQLNAGVLAGAIKVKNLNSPSAAIHQKSVHLYGKDKLANLKIGFHPEDVYTKRRIR